MPDLVSVIIPAFNAEKTIARAVDSVLAQTYSPVEVIVVDDGSTDGTCDICESYGDKITYIHQANKGVSAARNKGIQTASGEYIGFLDADDEYTSFFFSAFREAVSHYPGCKAFCGAYIVQCEDDTHRCVPDDFLGEEPFCFVDLIQEMAHGNYIAHTDTAILHKDVLNNVGHFIEGMHFGEDIELWTRIAGSFPWCFINRVMAIYHKETSSVTENTPLWEQGIEFIYDETHMRQVISSSLWGSYRKFRRNLCANRAWICFKVQKYDIARRMVRKIFPARVSLRYCRVLVLSVTPSVLLDFLFSQKNQTICRDE
jgi:glycosyltransferase involved in cell wall biosynthesis